MVNPYHLDLLNQSIASWNKWRIANQSIKVNLIGADLSGANLNGANLNDADLSKADLRGAKLSKADLSRAHFSETNLSRADLNGAKLNGANLNDADLSKADLSKADLRGARLSKADLSRADLSEAVISRANLREADFSQSSLSETVFADVNLAEAKNLDTCQYWGPSILDFRTLQLSGSLPLVFLRGCGLPDPLIDYLPALLNKPIQRYSCFISYSSKDEDFAKRLNADLQDKGVRCWFAPKDIKGGKKVHEQIDQAIRLYDKLLLVISEHSMNSEWVKTEIAKARRREVNEKRQILFPIRLVNYETILQWDYFDADIGKDSAGEIREYFIPDFSNWKDHDNYQQSFEHLLKDLKPELERKPVK